MHLIICLNLYRWFPGVCEYLCVPSSFLVLSFFSSLVLYAGSVSPFVSIRFVPFAVFVCIHSHIHTGVLYRYICICIWKCGGGESRSIKAMTCFHIISIRLCAVRALLLFCLVLAEGAWAERGRGGAGHTQSEDSTDVRMCPNVASW